MANKYFLMNKQITGTIIILTLLISSLALSSLNKTLPPPTPNTKIIPELKGLKLGATMEEVRTIAHGKNTFARYDVVDLKNEYLVGITKDSEISTIGGGEFTMNLSFEKGQDMESSILYSISVTLPAGAYDAMLKGLTEKYGEGRIIGNESRDWYFFDGRYRIGFHRNSELSYLNLTDNKINSSMVDRNKKQDEEKKKIDSKDL